MLQILESLDDIDCLRDSSYDSIMMENLLTDQKLISTLKVRIVGDEIIICSQYDSNIFALCPECLIGAVTRGLSLVPGVQRCGSRRITLNLAAALYSYSVESDPHYGVSIESIVSLLRESIHAVARGSKNRRRGSEPRVAP